MRAAGALCALLSVAAIGGVAAVDAADQPKIGQEAPAFGLPTLGGETASLSDYSGKLVVLHFGAGW